MKKMFNFIKDAIILIGFAWLGWDVATLIKITIKRNRMEYNNEFVDLAIKMSKYNLCFEDGIVSPCKKEFANNGR